MRWNVMPKLTEKQKRFADYYIETGNITESAVRAGYSKNYANAQGYKMLENVGIKQYIDERLKEMDEKRIMKAEEVMQLLTAIARNEVTEDVVVFNEGMTAIEQKGMSAKDRLKALELIGKRYAMWTEKQQVENITPVFLEDVPEDDD